MSWSPGWAGAARLTTLLFEFKTEASPVPVEFCVDIPGAYVASVMLNGADWAPLTVTVRVAAPGETSNGISTVICVARRGGKTYPGFPPTATLTLAALVPKLEP